MSNEQPVEFGMDNPEFAKLLQEFRRLHDLAQEESVKNFLSIMIQTILQQAGSINHQTRQVSEITPAAVLPRSGKEITTLLDANGVSYDLTEWVSVEEYARLFGIRNATTLLAAISRGAIPAENVIEIKALNNLRLIKAVPYY